MNSFFNNTALYNYYKKITLANKKYVCLNQKQFAHLMKTSIIYTEIEDDEIKGLFIINMDHQAHYITLLYGDDETKESLIERYFCRFPTQTLWVHFLNPNCLAWYPKKGIIHPCMQGVILNSDDYHFYKSQQFQVHSTQVTFYMALDTFHLSNEILKLKQVHLESGIAYTFYEPSQFDELVLFFDNLQINTFKTAVFNQLSASIPLLIVTHQQKIIGFTGPLKVESSKRGYFTGIAILDEYQGKKIGKVLFHELCYQLKLMHAQYMTLFTHVDNPAKHIYLGAGFEVIETCVTLKRNGK